MLCSRYRRDSRRALRLRDAKVETTSDILFIGNVGEEGPGDLRGVRYLFTQGKYKDRIRRFITVDGGNLDLVAKAKAQLQSRKP